MFSGFRALLLFAKSLKRIADALEEQNRITKHQLLEMYGLVVPDPAKKWTKQEREAEVSYGEMPTKTEDEEAEDWLKDV